MLRRSARLLSPEIPCKTFSVENLIVKHDCSALRFNVKLEQLEENAVLCYTKVDAKTVDLYHTEVPVSFQGLGVAKVLAKGAFDFCVENNLRMKLTCTYLQKYYSDNPLPQYTKLLID